MARTFWTTASGQRIKLSDMTDGHLINAIRYIDRQAQAWLDHIPEPMFQGEMAQVSAEQYFYRSQEDAGPDEDDERMLAEIAAELHPHYGNLVNEAKRRGLKT